MGKREESREPLFGPIISWSCESSFEVILRLCSQSISVGMAPKVELTSVKAEVRIAEASERENDASDAMFDSTKWVNSMGSF